MINDFDSRKDFQARKTAEKGIERIAEHAKNISNKKAGVPEEYNLMIYGFSPEADSLSNRILFSILNKHDDFIYRRPKKITLVSHKKTSIDEMLAKDINTGINIRNAEHILGLVNFDFLRTDEPEKIMESLSETHLTLFTANRSQLGRDVDPNRVRYERALQNLELVSETASLFNDYYGHLHIVPNIPEVLAHGFALRTNMHPNQISTSNAVKDLRLDSEIYRLLVSADRLGKDAIRDFFTTARLYGTHENTYIDFSEIRIFDSEGEIVIDKEFLISQQEYLTTFINSEAKVLVAEQKRVQEKIKGPTAPAASQAVARFMESFNGRSDKPLSVGVYYKRAQDESGFYLTLPIWSMPYNLDGRVVIIPDIELLNNIDELTLGEARQQLLDKQLVPLMGDLESIAIRTESEAVKTYYQQEEDPLTAVVDLKKKIYELDTAIQKMDEEHSSERDQLLVEKEILQKQVEENQLTVQKLSDMETRVEELTGTVGAYLKKEALKRSVDLDLKGKLYALDKTQQGFTKQVLEFDLFNEKPIRKYQVQLGHEGSDNPGKASSINMIACGDELFALYSRIAKSSRKKNYGVVVWKKGVKKPKQIMSLDSEPVDLLVVDNNTFIALEDAIISGEKYYGGIHDIESIALIDNNLFALGGEGLYRWNINQNSKPQLVKRFNNVYDIDSFDDSLLVGKTFSDKIFFFNPFDGKYTTFDSKEAIYSVMRYEGDDYKGIVLATADIGNGLPRVTLFTNENELFNKRGETLVAPNEFNVEQIINSELSLSGKNLLMLKDDVRVLNWTQPSREASKYSPRNALLDNMVIVYD